MDPYNPSYPKTYLLRHIDSLPPFSRWWKNFSTEQYPPYIPTTHWVTIEPQHRITSRGKTVTYYLATIGADHTEATQSCTFEPGTPPPPAYFYPATERYIPPPPPKVLYPRERKAQELLWIVQQAEYEVYRKANPAPPVVPSLIQFN